MLGIAVFLCGAVVIVIELTGSRVLAPYLGTSLVVWTNLIGSISGTFLAGFVLIPRLGSSNILLLMTAVLALASLLAARSHARIKVAACAIFLLLLFMALSNDKKMAAAGFVDVDTPYNRVVVLNGSGKNIGRVLRVMITGPHAWQSAKYLDDPSELALPYSRFYRLAKYFAPDMRRLLVLGGGRFSFPKCFLCLVDTSLLPSCKILKIMLTH